MPNESKISVHNWGRTAYAEAFERQKAQVQSRIDGTVQDSLIFTEHDPVYTIGMRSGSAAHLLWDPTQLSAQGITVAETNRGGDITYHGPGQVVGYPIMDISVVKDLHAYLRFLEEVIIRALGNFGLAATRRDGLTGIWLGQRKIAAIGVAVRRWITYHGFALNVHPDLTHFDGIVPCGIADTDGTVTSMARELSDSPTMEAVEAVLTREFQGLWPEFVANSDFK